MIGRTQLAVVEHDEEIQTQTIEEKIADESEIRRVVDEIDNACDLKDWKRLRVYFTDEIDADFTSLAGGAPAKIKADDLVEGWKTNLFETKKSFHQRTNHSIKVSGDKAEVFSKAYAFNLLETGKVTGLWEVWGNYTHTLKKAENGWRCSGMTLDMIYQRGDEKVRNFVPKK
ncbi:MAG: nuclear transport factor 2 family protein [Acidobacteriota bacterium]|nr:nuclear transport factor 2 family protein [Acidobacteriota bacterium]